ncbi:sodium:solute symporter family protein [Chromohalobacter israelensis]|uniref:sodium:solute symporter family protein n=1 Tax=Chromohalobacter israelensis TaxID=141390 RepID=UPI001CC52822|nr:sodium:solute symporter family protein [Chromohalobacter salexigens]MBZ5876508.1 sodium:solute symporter family protein [Chromohalobacter salexigens]
MTPTLVWGAVILYTLIALGVAWRSRERGSQTPDMAHYFLGGRRMGGLVSALSYSATTYSAFMMVGLAGLTYAGGVGALGFEIVYFAGVSLVAIFGPRFWAVGKAFGFVTPSEMLGHRYANRAVAVVMALVSSLFLIPYAAVQLAGVGYLLSGMTDGAIGFTTGVAVATALALLFTFIAGIRSVMWTDALQALLMIVAATLVALLVVASLGGFAAVFETLAREHPEALTVPGSGLFTPATFLGLTIPWFFFSLSNPQVSQRLFMPASLPAMRRMLIGFLCFGLVYTVVSVMWGFSALIAFPDLASSDLATPTLLASAHVPPVLGVVVMVGILAAAVSTIDSIMLTLSSMLSRDVYAMARGGDDEQRQLRAGKMVLPVIALLALGFAELRLDLIAVLSVAASTGLVVTVPALIGAFFWRGGTAAGALASMLGGGVWVLGLYATGVTPLGWPPGIWALPVAAALFVAVSLCTAAPRHTADTFIATAERALPWRR